MYSNLQEIAFVILCKCQVSSVRKRCLYWFPNGIQRHVSGTLLTSGKGLMWAQAVFFRVGCKRVCAAILSCLPAKGTKVFTYNLIFKLSRSQNKYLRNLDAVIVDANTDSADIGESDEQDIQRKPSVSFTHFFTPSMPSLLSNITLQCGQCVFWLCLRIHVHPKLYGKIF